MQEENKEKRKLATIFIMIGMYIGTFTTYTFIGRSISQEKLFGIFLVPVYLFFVTKFLSFLTDKIESKYGWDQGTYSSNESFRGRGKVTLGGELIFFTWLFGIILSLALVSVVFRFIF